jgi:hypothetical protein
MSNIFNTLKPQDTYTIEQFIQCQSDEEIDYHNFSYIDRYDNIEYSTYNILSDYLDELREDYAKTIILDKDQMVKYMYRPKLLCYDVYGNTELAFIILLLNDMCNVKDFTRDRVLMLTKDDMSDVTKWIYNSNKNAIAIYNGKNNHDLQTN